MVTVEELRARYAASPAPAAPLNKENFPSIPFAERREAALQALTQLKEQLSAVGGNAKPAAQEMLRLIGRSEESGVTDLLTPVGYVLVPQSNVGFEFGSRSSGFRQSGAILETPQALTGEISAVNGRRVLTVSVKLSEPIEVFGVTDSKISASLYLDQGQGERFEVVFSCDEKMVSNGVESPIREFNLRSGAPAWTEFKLQRGVVTKATV